MKNVLLAASAAATLAFVAAPASAAVPANVYGQLTAGVSVASKAEVNAGFQDLAGSGDLDFKVGPVLSGALGVSLGNGLRTDFEVVSTNNEFDHQAEAAQLGIIHPRAKSWLGLVNLTYDYALNEKWSPYIGVGVGMGKTVVEIDHDDTGDNGLAWQAKVGVGYKASDKVTVDVGYRYIQLPKWEKSYEGANLEAKSHLNALTAGIRFGF